MSLDQAFGQAVREYRKQQLISQEELAFRADVHRTYISQIERGMKSPSLKIIHQLACALEIKTYELVRRAEEIAALSDASQP